MKKEMKKKNLPLEPEENNPNSLIIALRYPHDGNLLKRRFLKNEKIQVLYMIKHIYIVKSLYL